MPRIIREIATAIGTTIAIVHARTRTNVDRKCQHTMMAATP